MSNNLASESSKQRMIYRNWSAHDFFLYFLEKKTKMKIIQMALTRNPFPFRSKRLDMNMKRIGDSDDLQGSRSFFERFFNSPLLHEDWVSRWVSPRLESTAKRAKSDEDLQGTVKIREYWSAYMKRYQERLTGDSFFFFLVYMCVFFWTDSDDFQYQCCCFFLRERGRERAGRSRSAMSNWRETYGSIEEGRDESEGWIAARNQGKCTSIYSLWNRGVSRTWVGESFSARATPQSLLAGFFSGWSRWKVFPFP
jgi:hypothetical protein